MEFKFIFITYSVALKKKLLHFEFISNKLDKNSFNILD